MLSTFKFNQEHFEAWLFAQPRERRVRYVEGHKSSLTGCVLCNYMQDNGLKFEAVGPCYISTPEDAIEIPDTMSFSRILHCENLDESQDAYEATFGKICRDEVPKMDAGSTSPAPGNEASPVNQVELQTLNQK